MPPEGSTRPKQPLDLTTNLSEVQGIEEHRKLYHGDAIMNIQAMESSIGKNIWFLQQQQKMTRNQRITEGTYRLKDT